MVNSEPWTITLIVFCNVFPWLYMVAPVFAAKSSNFFLVNSQWSCPSVENLQATGTPRSSLDFGVSPRTGVPQVGKDLPKLWAAGLRDVVPPRCAKFGVGLANSLRQFWGFSSQHGDFPKFGNAKNWMGIQMAWRWCSWGGFMGMLGGNLGWVMGPPLRNVLPDSPQSLPFGRARSQEVKGSDVRSSSHGIWCWMLVLHMLHVEYRELYRQ